MNKLLAVSLLIYTTALFGSDAGGDDPISITIQNTTKTPITVYRHETNEVFGPIDIALTTIPEKSKATFPIDTTASLKIENIDELLSSDRTHRLIAVSRPFGILMLWNQK